MIRRSIRCLLLLMVCYAAEAAENTNRAVYVDQLAVRDYGSALVALKQAVNESPTRRSQLLFYLAEALLQQGESERGKSLLRDAASTEFNQRDAVWRLLTLAKDEGNERDVMKYEAMLADLKRSKNVQFTDGMREGKYRIEGQQGSADLTTAAAIRLFETGDGFPGESDGDRLVQVGRYAHAIEAYEYALSSYVRDSDLLTSSLAARLYGKLSHVYSEQAVELKRQQQNQAAALAHEKAQHYREKSQIVKGRDVKKN